MAFYKFNPKPKYKTPIFTNLTKKKPLYVTEGILLLQNIKKNICIEVFFMETKRICLDYKDENGKLRPELKNGVHDMENIEGFSAEEFYINLDTVIREIGTKKSHKIAQKLLHSINPEILFGTYFYILKSLDMENNLEEEFDYLKQFIDCKIDIFMIVNFINK